MLNWKIGKVTVTRIDDEPIEGEIVPDETPAGRSVVTGAATNDSSGTASLPADDAYPSDEEWAEIRKAEK